MNKVAKDRDKLKDKIKELWNQTPRLTVVNIQAQLGITKNVLNNLLYEMIEDGEILRRNRMGTTLSLTQLQEDRLLQIIEMKNSGKTWKQIGEEFGLSRQAMHAYVKHHYPEYFES